MLLAVAVVCAGRVSALRRRFCRSRPRRMFFINSSLLVSRTVAVRPANDAFHGGLLLYTYICIRRILVQAVGRVFFCPGMLSACPSHRFRKRSPLLCCIYDCLPALLCSSILLYCILFRVFLAASGSGSRRRRRTSSAALRRRTRRTSSSLSG